MTMVSFHAEYQLKRIKYNHLIGRAPLQDCLHHHGKSCLLSMRKILFSTFNICPESNQELKPDANGNHVARDILKMLSRPATWKLRTLVSNQIWRTVVQKFVRLLTVCSLFGVFSLFFDILIHGNSYAYNQVSLIRSRGCEWIRPD